MYENTEFVEFDISNVNKEALGFLELNKKSDKGFLYLNPNIGDIDKLTIIRIGKAVCRSGFLFSDNERVGLKFELIENNEFSGVFDKFKTIVGGKIESTTESESNAFESTSEVESKPITEPEIVEQTSEIEDESERKATFETITDHFWEQLFGQEINTWEELPEVTKKELVNDLQINNLSDEQIKTLFEFRQNNDKKGFYNKLKEFQ
jgi:hypothetical protein